MIELFEITIAVCSAWIIVSELVVFFARIAGHFSFRCTERPNEYSRIPTSSQASACLTVDGRPACQGWEDDDGKARNG